MGKRKFSLIDIFRVSFQVRAPAGQSHTPDEAKQSHHRVHDQILCISEFFTQSNYLQHSKYMKIYLQRSKIL